MEVFGIYDGTLVWLPVKFIPDAASVGDIISRGGTFLHSARYPEFAQLEGQLKGIEQLKNTVSKESWLSVETVLITGYALDGTWIPSYRTSRNY